MLKYFKTYIQNNEVDSYTFSTHRAGDKINITLKGYNVSTFDIEGKDSIPNWLIATLNGTNLTLSLQNDIYDTISYNIVLTADEEIKKTFKVTHIGLTDEEKDERGIPRMECSAGFDNEVNYNVTGAINKTVSFLNSTRRPTIYAWYSEDNTKYRFYANPIISQTIMVYRGNSVGTNYFRENTSSNYVSCNGLMEDGTQYTMWQEFKLTKKSRTVNDAWRGEKELIKIFNPQTVKHNSTTLTIPLYIDSSILSISDVVIGHQSTDVIKTCTYNDNRKEITITFSQNETIEPQITDFTISGNLTNETGTVSFETLYATLKQEPTPTSETIYTGKDYVFNYITTDSDVYYNIKDINDTLIYQGKYYVKNNQCSIYLNDILKNYVKPNITLTEDSISNGAKQFILNIGYLNNNEFNAKESYILDVYNYYMFNDNNFGKDFIINMPIQQICTSGQYLQCSIRKKFDESRDVYTFFSINGTRTESKDVNFGDNNYLHIVNETSDVFYYVEGYKFSENLQFKYVNACQYNLEYEIIYKNPLGGYDNVLFISQSKQTDNIVDDNQITINRLNTDISGSKFNIDRTITRNWNLKTMRLTKDEASRLPYLFESNELYLHKLGTNEFIPILITDKRVEYVNAATKKQQYRINVEEARSYRIR